MHVSGDGSARSSKASSLLYDGMLAQVLVLVLTIYFASISYLLFEQPINRYGTSAASAIQKSEPVGSRSLN